MAELTLQQIFGANATQTATELVIKKSDLQTVGLTVAADNRGEQLFVAIFAKAKQVLNKTAQETNPDLQITIETGYTAIVFRNDQEYKQVNFTVGLEKLETASGIDPDDY
ncbi:MAG: hypothetical protein KME31_33280 [Tolypothrix carrinoi HA7290-LM1]|jgi:hypothetical protein|nr:hypothetical protein [Tolypothrix carrinoi HA7290-LM1]